MSASRSAPLLSSLLLLSALVSGAGTAQAAEAAPTFARHFATFDLRGRSQPTGLVVDSSLILRQTHSAPGSLLLDQTYREIGIDASVSPALAEAGLHAEWLPLRILKLRAETHALSSFGLLGYTLSFPSPASAYGDREVEAREGEEEAGLALRLSLQPTLQVKVGRLVARHTAAFYWHDFSGYRGPVVRERLFDQLQATDGDGMQAHTSLVAWEVWDGPGDALAIVGGFHEWVESFEAETSRQRAGLVAVLIPAPDYAGFRRPRLYLQAGSNLADRNREGAVFVQGGLGVDLWLAEQL